MKPVVIAMSMLCAMAVFLVSGCGAGIVDANVGGTVTGLSGGTTVGLLNNNIDPISVGGNGNFNFDVKLQSGAPYNITVGTQPVGETCTVVNGAGTVDQSGDDVTSVEVNCNATIASGNKSARFPMHGEGSGAFGP